MHKKRRRKNWYTRKHGKTFMQVSPIFGDLYNGNVRKEVLIFLIVFEWNVLNSHNFDLPDVNNPLQKCWDTPTKNRPFLLQIAPGHRSSLPFKVVPPSFEHGLVLLATLISLWRGDHSTRSWTSHLCQNTVQCLEYFCSWLNQYCSNCRISVNLQWKDFQDKPWINSICFGNESKQCLFFKVFSSAN